MNNPATEDTQNLPPARLRELDPRERDESVRLALHYAGIGVWIWDCTTNRVVWSPECYQIAKVAEFDEQLSSFEKLVYPEDWPQVQRDLDEAVAAGKKYGAEFRIVRGDGEIRWISNFGQASYDLQGRPLRVIGTVQDITQRRQAEESSRDNQARLHILLEQAADSFYLIDRDCRIIDVNRRACETTGYTREELLRISVTDLETDFDRAQVHEVWSTLAQGAYVTILGHHRRKDGSVFPVEVRLGGCDSRGVRYVLALVRDISTRIKSEQTRIALEEQLRSAQKMEAIGRLAGGIAHDFNNLLTIISGYSRQLDQPNITAEMRRDAIDAIVAATGQGANLTKQLITFSRSQRIELLPLDLNSIIAAVEPLLHSVAAENGLAFELDPRLPQIHADRGQLEQVLNNLVSNARDAMPAGGEIRIRTRRLSLAEETLVAYKILPVGEYAELSVSDTGEGIPAGDRDHVLEPFFTTKPPGKGIGLGLAVVHGIVKESRGYVLIESQSQRGTCFRLIFPAV
ncbi:MAG TPA: PAS domain S-box protein [Pirellulales bacterium]|jgi:PAS domain S-box-containing protein|nr:PAS domain S-box protein [Pirellulales bacterium]